MNFSEFNDDDGQLVGDGSINSQKEFIKLFTDTYESAKNEKLSFKNNYSQDLDQYDNEEKLMRLIHLDFKEIYDINDLSEFKKQPQSKFVHISIEYF